MARKELVGVDLILPAAGAAGLAVERVQKKGSIGATAEEAIPVVNYVMASPGVFLMSRPRSGPHRTSHVPMRFSVFPWARARSPLWPQREPRPDGHREKSV